MRSSCRMSIEQRNCYCNGPGIWNMNMIQCGKCRRWFHDGCIQCLGKPMLYGDKFFVFVCSICNSGSEFLSRIELKWVDIAHLVLYNLSVMNKKKYYDFDSTIMPFLHENWNRFQLLGEVPMFPGFLCTLYDTQLLKVPPKLKECSNFYEISNKIATTRREDRKKSILETLYSNRKRFKNAKEIKKRQSLWSLRETAPPAAPHVTPAAKETEDIIQWAFKVPGRKSKLLHSIKNAHIVARSIKVEEPTSVRSKKPLGLNHTATQNGHATVVKVESTAVSQNGVKKATSCRTKKLKPLPRDDNDLPTNLLDFLIPPPPNFTRSNNPFRKSSKKPSSFTRQAEIKNKKGTVRTPVIHRLTVQQEPAFLQKLGNGHSNPSPVSIKNSFPNHRRRNKMQGMFLLDNKDLLQKMGVLNLKTGEFSVRGRRITPEGKIQYLFEWDR